MSRCHVRVLAFCLVALCVAIPVSAQTAPKTEISGGYQFLTFDADGDQQSMPKGWYFDVAGNLNPMWGVVFQVGGNYKTFDESVTIGTGTFTASADLKVHEFLGGLRLNARESSTFVPYGQVLVGGVNGSLAVTTTTTIPGIPTFSQSDSSTNFAFELGGGVNFGFIPRASLRFGVDYLRVFAEDAGSNAVRFHAGVVIGR